MAISSSATGLRPGVCTSTTRPTAPYNGQLIYETDTKKVYIYNGTSWVEQPTAGMVDAKGDLLVGTAADTAARLAVGSNDQVLVAASGETTGVKWASATSLFGTWTAFTPTWTNFTIGNGTNDFKYTIINKIMIVAGAVSLGSTSVMGTDPKMTIPASATAVGESWVLSRFLDTNSDNYYATAVASGTFIYLYRLADASVDDPRLRGVTSTSPFTWASGDTIWFNVQFPIS